jgi:predicted Zn-dependent peptidase
VDESAPRCRALAYHELVVGEASAWRRQLAAAQPLSADQVKRFAARWLRPERASVVELKPLRKRAEAAAP